VDAELVQRFPKRTGPDDCGKRARSGIEIAGLCAYVRGPRRRKRHARCLIESRCTRPGLLWRNKMRLRSVHGNGGRETIGSAKAV
jgi:hypothetical protein